MVSYNGKSIFEAHDKDIAVGDKGRKAYLDSINRFIESKYAEGYDSRSRFIEEELVRDPEGCRKKLLSMLGEPCPYPLTVPTATSEHLGKDDFCDIYALQIEVMPDFRFYGLLMVPFGAEHAPLVIAQHGGGSSPEICGDLLGVSNYGFFTKRALEHGMVVFAPQLLLWKFDIDTGEKQLVNDLQYRRDSINNQLRPLGLTVTGLEIFCIRRSIDYLSTLAYVDENRIGMMGLSYGGYFSLYTAAVDTRIRSVYAAGFFNDRTKVCFIDWNYPNAANTFMDAEVAALVAPRRLQVDVGLDDPVFDYRPSENEGKRAADYYARLGAPNSFRYNLWKGGHRFDESGSGFDFFFDGI